MRNSSPASGISRACSGPVPRSTSFAAMILPPGAGDSSNIMPAAKERYVQGRRGEIMTNIRDARASFPGTGDKVFLDAACVSLMPVQADQALRRLSEELLACPARDASAHHIALDRT